MRPYTNEEAQQIAEACKGYLDAHDRRSTDANGMTLREQGALGRLVWEIAARERDALSAAMGTAA